MSADALAAPAGTSDAAFPLHELAVVAVAALPVQEADEPVVFWLNVGQVKVPVEKLPLVGVPSTGVTSVGEVARTGAPDPVAVVHTGRADVPPPTRISVVAPAASVCCAPVAVVPAAIRA